MNPLKTGNRNFSRVQFMGIQDKDEKKKMMKPLLSDCNGTKLPP